MSVERQVSGGQGGPAVRRRSRWLALMVLAGSQLLIVLDATIVNVALADISADLRFTPASLQWVITAYTLAFGGFLLLGGRLADRLGRRRVFVAGVGVFTAASLLGGFAASQGLLIAARAAQGFGAAVMAPAALSLLLVVFPAGRDRTIALGVWAGVTAGGTAIGLILGGLLTQGLSWPWVFWINVPIGLAATVPARRLLPAAPGRATARLDIAGLVTGTGGLVALVLGLVRTVDFGWDSGHTLVPLALAAVLLTAFGVLQKTRPAPLIPLRVLRNRTVLGADLVGLIFGTSIYALFYFLSLFMAGTLGYGPIRIGLAFLPLTIAIAIAARFAGVLIARTGPRPMPIAGSLLIAIGLALLIRIAPGSSYLGTVFPPLVLAGVGMGLAFVALTSASVAGVAPSDSGIAAALFNAGQQIGGTLGLAVLTAASTARAKAITGDEASSAGWAFGFGVAAAIMLVGAYLSITMVKPEHVVAGDENK